MTVVRYYEYGLFNVAEIVFQPLNSVEVEVVGRLIEKEVVWVAEECLCQHHAHLLCIREISNEFVVAVFLYAEVLQKLCGTAFSLPTIHFCKLELQLSSEVTIFFCHLWLSIEALALLHVFP
ncbi:Uncharacterised protein [Segatella copri]|nr:Uncharacterised protein [Segatella copri]